MTIDEAIKHAEEVAEEHTKYNRYGGFDSCDECAKEHRQLANWLKELKQLREQEPCEDAISRRAVLNTLDKMDSVLDEDRTVETYKELLVACYNDLPSIEMLRDWQEEVKAIPLDKVKQAKDEIWEKVQEYSGSGNEVTQAYCDGFKDSLAILDKLIESEEEE